MSRIRINNVKVAGNGRQAMMFAHGFGCDQNMWRFVAPEFAGDFRTILFDHVGAGGSDLASFSASKYASLDGYADDVIDICRELNVSDIVFVGHSVSAMIGALAARKAPELFSSLIMIGPSPRYIDDENYRGGFSETQIQELLEFLDSNHMGWSAAMAPAVMGNADRPELTQELTNSFCRTDPEIARHFARTTFTGDNRADLPHIGTRTLVMQCSDDLIAPTPVGEFVDAMLPNSELVYLQATGHCPNLSAPAEVVAAMRSFLAKASA